MPKISAIGEAVPPFPLGQEQTREFAALHFGKGRNDISRLVKVFDTVEIRRRYFSAPLEWFGHPHTFEERNDLFVEWAERLSGEAIENCLNQAELDAKDVDHLVFVSTSGVATPSIDARLVNRFPFPRHVRRTPLFGLGCAGGAAGLSLCAEIVRSRPAARVLLVAVELSSLTFQRDDFTKSNLVASALFADGAAAALVCGDDTPQQGVSIIASQSTIWPETLDVMGWRFRQSGMHVIFSKSIPQLLKTHIRKNISEFLEPNGARLSDLCHYAIHPGGAKVLQSFQESLDLPRPALVQSRQVLENYGNMSSPTVLFVLNRVMVNGAAEPGELGLAAAFGPGFSAELLLLRW